jgi:CheY-like chemotaxis protein
MRTATPNPRLRVLVVEDHVPTLELMCEVIASLGNDVSGASDSREAVTLINKQKFDGIFLDLLMPVLDGFRLAQSIRESGWNKSTPIIIVTASEDRETIERAFAAGGSFFLRKPVDRQRLTVLLNSTRGAMIESRRRFMRIPVHMRMTCQRGDKTIPGVCQNLSEKGLLFEGDGSLVSGEQVKLLFRLPGQDSNLATKGVVTRTIDRLAGIAFKDLSATDRQRIRLFIGQGL